MALYRDVDGEGAIPVSHMENNREFFELKYTAARVRAARRIEEAALGQVVGVTESRVSQIIRKTVKMIREYIEALDNPDV